MYRIAIGIATLRRPEGLQKLLDSLRAQDFGSLAVKARIIVVDNEPEPRANSPTAAVITEARKNFPFPLEVYHEPRRGIPYARNAVVAQLRDEEALFFIDDDEVAPPHWIRTMLDYAQAHPEADILTGRFVQRFPEVPEFAWTKRCRLFSPLDYPEGNLMTLAATNNLMVTRKVWQSMQPLFDVDFNLSGGSDTYFSVLARKRGFQIHWVRGAEVDEFPPLSRATLRWCFRRSLRTGTVYGYICRKEALPIVNNALQAGLKGVILLVLGTLTLDKGRAMEGFCRIVNRGGILLGRFTGYRYREYEKL
jgi:succinoglycan biosynthesis protein ExoM